MNLEIEEQIPLKIKLSSQCQIAIPKDIRTFLNWQGEDELELYATTKGLFMKKGEITNDKETKENIN